MRQGETARLRMRVLVAVLAVAALLTGIYHVGRLMEKSFEKPEVRGDHQQRYDDDILLQANGSIYRRRKNLVTILLMGIDQSKETQRADACRNGGQADFLRLVVIDPTARTVSQVQIDRDTMTPVTVLGVLGTSAGKRTAQVCLSHGFGDGGAQSCQLTVEAVSDLLMETPIDFYLAMNLDGISVLNDLAGGVTVTLTEDFSFLSPAMTAGTTLTLWGEQAETYVRTRRDIGAETNEERMARQEAYLSGLTSLLDKRLREDKTFIGDLYDDLASYLTTDMGRGRMINEVLLARDYDRRVLIRLKGTYQEGEDGFMQFDADEEALKQTVLTLFYEEVK